MEARASCRCPEARPLAAPEAGTPPLPDWRKVVARPSSAAAQAPACDVQGGQIAAYQRGRPLHDGYGHRVRRRQQPAGAQGANRATATHPAVFVSVAPRRGRKSLAQGFIPGYPGKEEDASAVGTAGQAGRGPVVGWSTPTSPFGVTAARPGHQSRAQRLCRTEHEVTTFLLQRQHPIRSRLAMSATGSHCPYGLFDRRRAGM